MNPAFVVEAILFDCDGVLVDSMASVHEGWSRWADEYKLDHEHVFSIIHGRRAYESVQMLVPTVDPDVALQRIEDLEVETSSDVVPIRGARELTNSIPPGRWAIATSGTRRLAHVRLASAGYVLPPVVITADDVTNGKPAPDPWLLAARRLGVDPTHCVVIEDSPSGVAAARAAGCAVIAVSGSFPHLDLGGDATVADLRSVRCTSLASGELAIFIDH